jgi:hypothetical protein
MNDNENVKHPVNTPVKDYVLPERRIPKHSDLYNPRWVGACCDFTAMLLNMKVDFSRKECSNSIECVATLKKDDTI